MEENRRNKKKSRRCGEAESKKRRKVFKEISILDGGIA